MKTVKLSDFYPYDKDKGGIQELPHKFKYQILNKNRKIQKCKKSRL